MSPASGKLRLSLGDQVGFFLLPSVKVASFINGRYGAISNFRIETPNFRLRNGERKQRRDAIFWIIELALVLPECLASSLIAVHPIFDELAVVIADVQSDVAREEFCAPNAHVHDRTKVLLQSPSLVVGELQRCCQGSLTINGIGIRDPSHQ